MAGFAVEDAFIKSASTVMPLGQIIIMIGLLGIVAFATIAVTRAEPVLPRAILSRTMAIRSGFEITGRLFYALAIAQTPLSVAAAVLQASPLVVVLGAAWLFGEKVGVRRWIIILAGFCGVLIILRPGLAGFDALSVLALIGMLGFSGRDLATRAAAPSLSNAQLGVAGFIMLTLAGGIILAVTGGAVVPQMPELAKVIGAAVFGVAGYGAITQAMRTGEVAVVTPFRYTRLLFAMILGITFFGERPDAATLLGSAIIVGCGVLILTMGRKIT